jgi:formylmethanofuran dehydrogenase subunit B
VNQIVGNLNISTRAASLWIGGGNGAATVNQVVAWLSGLPLRSRAGPLGLEHEPLCFDTNRLLADGAVDALLWVSSFEAQAAPPPNSLPMVVLGHPGLVERCRRDDARTLFIPVATPGIGEPGHVFRTDGTVLMPLDAALDSGLPSVSQVLSSIERSLVKGTL